MSPRQYQQAGLLAVCAVFFVALIITGKGVVLPVVGLVACAVTATGTVRYYRRGGKPLDRGGRPFWRR
jgi:hypothetical protein